MLRQVSFLAQDEDGLQQKVHTLTTYLLLGPVFYPVLQKLYDGVFVSIIVNCCRKKFDANVAAATALTVLLALPAFLVRLTGFGGGGAGAASLAARMGGTTKSLLAEAKKQRQARKQATVKMQPTCSSDEAPDVSTKSETTYDPVVLIRLKDAADFTRRERG